MFQKLNQHFAIGGGGYDWKSGTIEIGIAIEIGIEVFMSLGAVDSVKHCSRQQR